MLHVTNGDSTVEGLRQAPVVGDIVAWRDVLHEGPVPALSAAELRPVRARFLARWTAGLEADLRARDERLSRGARGGERSCCGSSTTSTTSSSCCRSSPGCPTGRSGVELICVGSFPGRPGFAGLGELDARRAREPVAVAHAGGQRARARGARGLGRLPRARPARAAPARPPRRTRGCRTSRRALRRLLEELPGARDGLSRTRAPAARRRRRGRPHARAGVPRCRRVRGGALPRRHDRVRPPRGPRRAARTRWSAERSRSPSRAPRCSPAAPTACALNGFDRWLGGTHLRAADGLWRWDAERGALVDP